jgi:hypothetical protein
LSSNSATICDLVMMRSVGHVSMRASRSAST